MWEASRKCCAPLALSRLAPRCPHPILPCQFVCSAPSSFTTTVPRDKISDNKGRRGSRGVVLGRDQTALPRDSAPGPHPATAMPPRLGLMVSLRCVRKAGNTSVQGQQESRAGKAARRGKATAAPWVALPERGEVGLQILEMGLAKRWRGYGSALRSGPSLR